MEYRIPAEASTTEAVVAALSRYEDVSPLALPPLHDSIPTDALDELFDGKDDRSVVCLSFTHMGNLVTIENGEKILIEAAQEITLP